MRSTSSKDSRRTSAPISMACLGIASTSFWNAVRRPCRTTFPSARTNWFRCEPAKASPGVSWIDGSPVVNQAPDAELAIPPAPAARLMSRRFRGFLPIVIDVECGGFNAATDALLEIAAVIIDMDENGVLKRGATHNYHVIPFAG